MLVDVIILIPVALRHPPVAFWCHHSYCLLSIIQSARLGCSTRAPHISLCLRVMSNYKNTRDPSVGLCGVPDAYGGVIQSHSSLLPKPQS